MTANKVRIEDCSASELFAYAKGMEREAAQRYAELADIMTTHNNPEVAEFFKRMADIEWIHVYHVGELSREMGGEDGSPPPARPGAHLLGAEIPDMLDMHYLHRPHHAISLALEYERRAVEYYAQIAKLANSEEVRHAARRLASEEEMHVHELERWLTRYPKPEEGWDEDPDPAVAQE